MKTISRLVLLSMATIATLFLTGCPWSNSRLSEKPTRVSSKWTPQTDVESTITAQVRVPYSYVSVKLNQSIPAQKDFAGRSHGQVSVKDEILQTVMTLTHRNRTVLENVLNPLGIITGQVERIVSDPILEPTLIKVPVDVKVPYDVDYHGSVTRGPITIGKNGDSVRVNIPISVNGQVGLNGDGAKLLLLNQKNVDGSLNGWADVKLGINEDWGPSVSIDPGYTWTSVPQIEVVHGQWISVQNEADDGVGKLMDNVRSDTPKSIPEDFLKTPAQGAWRRTSFPAPIKGSPNGSVVFVPKKAGFSGIQYTSDSLLFSLSLTGQTTFYTVPPTAESPLLILPKLQVITAGSNGFNFIIPLNLNYNTITEQLRNAFINNLEVVNTSVGKVTIHFSDFEVFQTENGKLSIGVYFNAKFEHHSWLSTRGVVWLVGTPYLDRDTQTFALKNVEFARILDNKLWSILTALFSGSVREKLETTARIDLKPLLAKAKNDAEHQTNDNPRFPAHMTFNTIKLCELGLTDENFVVVTQIAGTANIDLGTLK